MSFNQFDRRKFLQRSAAIAGASFMPLLGNSPCQAGSSNDARIRVGCIGVGGRGSYVGGIASKLGVRVACADVNRQHAEKFAGGGNCEVYSDYRRLLDRQDIDVVTIGTPDHWHTKILIDAVQSGKDVYCEKPLTLTIDEGKHICDAVRHTGRIVQVGTQQRSSGQFLMAVALARSGRLGKVLKATCSISQGRTGGPFSTAEVPAHLDWNMWQGQCPEVEYTPERARWTFRHWLEYSGGVVTDWGAHHVDIAQWALGYERSGPVTIEGIGDYPFFSDNTDMAEYFAGEVAVPNGYNAATTFQATHTFKNGSTLVLTNGARNGILIEGEKGRIHVNRGGITGRPIEELTEGDRKWLSEEVIRLYAGKAIDPFDVATDNTNTGIDRASTNHMQNLFECVLDRSQPASDVFTHHRTVSTCHLSNIAMLLGRKLRWDPDKQDFVDDAEANALLSRPQRSGFEITV